MTGSLQKAEKNRKWSEASTFKISTATFEPIKEFVFIWSYVEIMNLNIY